MSVIAGTTVMVIIACTDQNWWYSDCPTPMHMQTEMCELP